MSYDYIDSQQKTRITSKWGKKCSKNQERNPQSRPCSLIYLLIYVLEKWIKRQGLRTLRWVSEGGREFRSVSLVYCYGGQAAPQVHTLNSDANLMVFGGGVFGKPLSSGLSDGISALHKRGSQRTFLPLQPWENTVKRFHLWTWSGLHQTPHLPAS